MPKKSATRKRKPGFFAFFKRFFFIVLVGVVAFGTTQIVLVQKDRQPTCANSKSCTTDLTEKIENNATGIFQGKIIYPPKIDATKSFAETAVLGTTTSKEEKHIFVDLAAQTLYAYEGKKLFFKTLVSTGKWGKTPVGDFAVWQKLIATRMAGGEGAAAYDLPNVPYVMYFFHDFGLHGAYWHDNFGHTMSHGCVNMRQVDAKTLFDWADGPSGTMPGTKVSICNQITSDNQCIQDNPVQ